MLELDSEAEALIKAKFGLTEPHSPDSGDGFTALSFPGGGIPAAVKYACAEDWTVQLVGRTPHAGWHAGVTLLKKAPDPGEDCQALVVAEIPPFSSAEELRITLEAMFPSEEGAA